MALDWDKLRIFHAVAEAGSFTHAGEALGLSQSSVSRHIGTLEDSLGVILFHRHARGLALTEQGELLFSTTHGIFSKLALIEGQLVDTRDKAEGPLTVTAAEFVGLHWLAPRLPRFHEKCPGIQLTLLLDDRVLNLAMREADVALRLFQPNQPDLIQRPLARIAFGTYASTTYLSRCDPPRHPDDLRNHTLLGFPETGFLPFAQASTFARVINFQNHDAGRKLMTNSVSAMWKLVKSGCGVGVLPRFMAQGDPDLVALLPDVQHPSVEMYFVYPEVRRHSRRIEMFRDFVIDALNDGIFQV